MNHAKIGYRYKVLTTSFIQRHNIIYFNPNDDKLNLRIFQIWILCIIPILTLLWKKKGGPLDAVVDWEINKLVLVQKTNRRKEQNHLYSRLSSHQLNPCCLQVRYLLPIATVCPGSSYPNLYNELLYKLGYLRPGHMV